MSDHNDWELEQDVNSMIRYGEIQADTKRQRKVARALKKRQAAIEEAQGMVKPARPRAKRQSPLWS